LQCVWRRRLQAFFASVFAARVIGILRIAGYPEEVSRTLAALCTHRTPLDVLAGAPERHPLDLARLRTPHLPQGAPTSGALANLAAHRLDVRVAGLAAKLGASYARYADDLVLSGDRELARAAPTLVARLAAIASEEGFSLNFRKTRVMTASRRQRITGIVVNEKISAPRAEFERLRAILHNCQRHDPATQNRDDHADFRAHLRGRVAWIRSLDPRKGAQLNAMFEQIRWS
jgi:RNA-directed DNA polymerase